MHLSGSALTEEQINFFNEEGYLSIEELTDSEDVIFLRELYDKIFSEKAGRNLGDQFDLAGTDEDGKTQSLPQILNPAKYAPEMNESRLLINATNIAKQIFGESAVCEFAHAIYKPPLIGSETPWHQDSAYWKPHLKYKSISIWVPLQEAMEENGCMEFVPKSHMKDVLQHQSINNDPRIHGLELASSEMAKVSDSVKCPLKSGGATLHGPYMLHKTGPNVSDIPRRAIILNAMLPPETRDNPLRFIWQEQKETARDKRANDAKKAGLDVMDQPTG